MKFMISKGGQTLVGDETLVHFRKEGKLIGVIAIHVDDFTGAGTNEFFEDIIESLVKEFKISKRERNKFRFTGMDVEYEENGITVTQVVYSKNLSKMAIEEPVDPERTLTRKEYK